MIQVNITEAKGFSSEELRKVRAAQQTLIKIFNNDKFKDRILKFTTDGIYRFYYRKSLLGNWIDKPYSNHDVYEKLTSGLIVNKNDNKIELKLEMLPGGSIEQLGFTNPDTQRVYTYRNWFSTLSMAEYTSHLAHEWCHQLGFDHDKRPHEKTEFSVPFGIGKITERIAWEC
jgi:hypothetical protein